MEPPDFPPQFHPITVAWFRRRFGEPSPPQRLGWPLIAQRKHTLILAPTGSGKTLAAFLACIDALVWELLGEQSSGVRREASAKTSGGQRRTHASRLTPDSSRGVRILYVSPLKALNYDIEKNLREPLAGLAEEAERQGIALPEITVGVRTGDTRSKERQQMIRRPPHILITTPESLHLILTSQAKAMLSTVQFLILDEIHALCNNKRGVFTSLLLERLEEVRCSGVQVFGCSGVQGHNDEPVLADPNTRTPEHLNTFVRIGLSATQRPLEEVARFLGGAEWVGEELVPRPVEIVDAGMRKRLSLQVLCPASPGVRRQASGVRATGAEPSLTPDASPLTPGEAIARRVLSLLHGRKSTLVFANNRRQVERLTAQLNEAAGEEIALPHHGSIAAGVRKQTEERLKRGEVRAVCATGTLELGIDMGAVELVCQVESPRQVSKGLQRVGRAGHLMSAVSEGRILVKQPLDLLEAAVLGREMLAGRVERLHVPQNCLDVLAQQLVAMVADGERSLADLYRLVRQSYCYRDLPETQFQGTVAMISGRYPSHLFKDLQARVSLDRVRQRLLPLPGTQRAALTNGGTIPDTGQFGVYIGSSRVKLGELDEEFIYESRVGDIFSLGIDSWKIDRIEADRVLVSPAPGQPARMPFWRGESYGREPELGQAMGEFVAAIEERLDAPDVEEWIAAQVPVDATGARTLANYLRNAKEQCGALPTHRTLLVESFADEIGERRLAILSPLGRRVHLTLRLALAALIQERYGVDPEALHNDDGLLLRLPGGEAELPLDLLHQIPPEAVWELVVRQLASSPLFGLRFRQNAARALLLPGSRPGKRSPLWLQRLKAKDLLAVAADYDDFPIVLETYRECLEEFMAVDAVRALLEGLRDGAVRDVEVRRDTPSPFVASLLFDFQAIHMYEWDRPKGIGRNATEAQQRLVADLVGHLRQTASLLDPRTLEEREARLQGTAPDARARTPAEFLELLRRLGDLPADRDTIAARYTGDPDALLHTLCADRMLVQVPLPNAEHPWHWILTEEWPLYREAFLAGVQVFRCSGVQEGPSRTPERRNTQIRPPFGGHPEHLNTEHPPLTLRVADDREVSVEEAIPAVFLEPEAGEGDSPERRAEEARRSILRRFALHRILVTTGEVAAWYGLPLDATEAILRDLEALGALVCIPEAEADQVGYPRSRVPTKWVDRSSGHQVITSSSRTRWSSPEHLEGAYTATLARRRREARPASVAQYQQFLLAWQHRAPRGQDEAVRSSGHQVITPSSPAGEDGVRQVLTQLQGLPLPATVWEGEVLARRVWGYQPGWLDHLCQMGEFLWQGSPGAFAGRGRIAFFQRELFPYWPVPRDGSATSGEAEDEAAPLSGHHLIRSSPHQVGYPRSRVPTQWVDRSSSPHPHTSRIAEALRQRGASFLADLALTTGIDSRDVAVALWELIWQGLVTHDQWGVIRAGAPAGRPLAPSVGDRYGTAMPGRAPGRRPGYRGLSRPPLGGGRPGAGGLPGRYSWLPALRPEAGDGGGGTGIAAAAELVARQLLERYGVVARELLEMEAVSLPWGALYQALHVMELTGEVRRGYFVEGFSGAQFALPRAADELKELQQRSASRAPSFVLLNACDPANLYGGAVRLAAPSSEGEADRPEVDEPEGGALSPSPTRAAVVRLPSNYLVLRNGVPALLLETGARRLTAVSCLEATELAAACETLRNLTEHPWPPWRRFAPGPVRQLRIERWAQPGRSEGPIRGSEAEAPLRAIGFSLSPKGLEL